MMEYVHIAAIAGVLMLTASLQADPWKDESGHGRGGPPPWAGRGGEPPDWARGKGVWDGHWKHGYDGPPAVYRHYPPEDWRPRYYAPGADYRYPRYDGRGYVYPDRFGRFYEHRPPYYYGQGELRFRWEAWR